MPIVVRRFLALSLVSAWMLTGCDMAGKMQESIKHSAPIEAEIERAAGVKPNVIGISTGPVLMVTVQFTAVPDMSVHELEAVCRAAVVREFKTQPTTLMLSFAFQSVPA
jgi:hypothetical protein